MREIQASAQVTFKAGESPTIRVIRREMEKQSDENKPYRQSNGGSEQKA